MAIIQTYRGKHFWVKTSKCGVPYFHNFVIDSYENSHIYYATMTTFGMMVFGLSEKYEKLLILRIVEVAINLIQMLLMVLYWQGLKLY